jgi:hypothetical protein
MPAQPQLLQHSEVPHSVQTRIQRKPSAFLFGARLRYVTAVRARALATLALVRSAYKLPATLTYPVGSQLPANTVTRSASAAHKQESPSLRTNVGRLGKVNNTLLLTAEDGIPSGINLS